MPIFLELRPILRELIDLHGKLAEEAGINSAPIWEIRKGLESGELSVAVVGEINRGKSTFLNALIGRKLFPSRATICTAGVTILDHGEKAEAEVVYKTGKSMRIALESEEEPMKMLEKIVSRQNPMAKEVKSVRVWYPNKFTGNGIVLVDTPGVNDPEYWREEITYSYLASADAVIMLLDPMQPLSKSEMEFLGSKILGTCIANLIFVVNKIDDVNTAEREAALARIRKLLSQKIPNPTIFAVASKPALMAKMAHNPELLGTTGFHEFEAGLLDFLSRGRGGLLLRTKVKKAMEHLSTIEGAIFRRKTALETAKSEVANRLNDAKEKVVEVNARRKDMLSEIGKREGMITGKLSYCLSASSEHFESDLVPVLLRNVDTSGLRAEVLRFQRDTIHNLQEATQFELNNILAEFGGASSSLKSEIRDILGCFDISTENMPLQKQAERPASSVVTGMDAKRTGAAVGGISGGIAGMAVAHSLTTATVTATSIAVTGAVGTLGIIGAGILTGGIGLLIGLGVAALFSGDKNRSTPRAYIETGDFAANESTIQATRLFLKNLKGVIQSVSHSAIGIAIAAMVEPLDMESENQCAVIKQIEEDLKKTTQEQEGTRQSLLTMAEQAKTLRMKYNEMEEKMVSIGV